jgi:hypothetical protein
MFLFYIYSYFYIKIILESDFLEKDISQNNNIDNNNEEYKINYKYVKNINNLFLILI